MSSNEMAQHHQHQSQTFDYHIIQWNILDSR